MQRDVRVAEDDGVGVAGSAGACAPSRPAAGPASWTIAIRAPVGARRRARAGSAHAHLGLVDVAVHARRPAARAPRAPRARAAATKSPACRIRSAARRRSTHASGSRARAARQVGVGDDRQAHRRLRRGAAAARRLGGAARRASSTRSQHARAPGARLPVGPMSAESHVVGPRRRVPVVEVDARDPAAQRDELVEDASASPSPRAAADSGNVTLLPVRARDDAARLGEPDLARDVAWSSRRVPVVRSAVGVDGSCAAPSTVGSTVAARGGTP